METTDGLPYTIMKMGILDISGYVHCEVEIDDIEEKISDVLRKHKGCYCQSIPGMLYFKVATPYKLDAEVDALMKELVEELDALLAEKTNDITQFNLN